MENQKWIIVDSSNRWLYTGEIENPTPASIRKLAKNAEDYDRYADLYAYPVGQEIAVDPEIM